MASCGRIEAATTVPSGGWTVAINDGVAFSATLTAATIYAGPTAVAAALQTAINAAAVGAGSAKTYTVTIASGEQSTGYVTIAVSAGTFTLAWTTATLRDYLGWTAGLSLAGAYTSPSGCLGMWLPNSPILQPYPLGESGDYEGGVSQAVTPAGVVKVIKTTSRRRHPGITWSHVSLARARQASEASGVRSWERFVRDCLRGDTNLACFTAGGDVKIWWNADSGTPTPVVFHPLVPNAIADVLAPSTGDGYVGLYRCTWPGGYA